MKVKTHYNDYAPDSVKNFHEPVDNTIMVEENKSLTVKELFERTMSGGFIPEGASYERPIDYDGDDAEKVAAMDTSAREEVDMGEAINVMQAQKEAALEQAQAAKSKRVREAAERLARKTDGDKPLGATASEPAVGEAKQSPSEAKPNNS